MRDEVLQDHLLQVSVLGVHLGQRLQRGQTLLRALADADQDPAREGDLQLARGPDRLQPSCRMLGRGARVDGLHQPLGDRLEHQSLGGAHLAQPRQVLAREHAEVGVREQAPFQRPLAGPDDVGGEVLVSVGAQALADLGVDLGQLAGQHEQLLDPAPGGAVEHLEHLLGAVEVRPVGGEGAVLAVAAAGPRQREREVAREGDAAAHALGPLSFSDAPARWRRRRARPHYAQAKVSRRPGPQVYLARHGRTAYNLEGRFQGQQAIPLDDVGRGQARELAERAVAYGFVALWCSPLLRARETAEIVGRRLGLELRDDERLMETDAGDWTNLSFEEVRAREPERFEQFISVDPGFSFPGGESFAEQDIRVAAAIEDVEQGPLPALVVCHGMVDPRGAHDPRRAWGREHQARRQRRAGPARPGGGRTGRPRRRSRDGRDLAPAQEGAAARPVESSPATSRNTPRDPALRASR